MFWVAAALAAPLAGYGFDEVDGSVAFDAFGAAHGCLDEGVERVAGPAVGFRRDGVVRLPIVVSDVLTLGAQVRSYDSGVVLHTGDLELAVSDGRVVVSGIGDLDGGPIDRLWHHIAVGVGMGVVKLFVDGVEVASGPANGALAADLTVGGRADLDDLWDGDLDGLTVSDAFPDAAVVAAAAEPVEGRVEGVDCADYDQDTLDDEVEATLGTDPQALDSDGDTFPDPSEVGDLSRPLDTDGDGVLDALDTDDDGDGIPSVEERVADADGDGAPDLDPDGDGLDNGIDTDSDGDGLLDADEGTQDSDGDGIADFLDITDDRTTTGNGATNSAGGGAGSTKDGCGCAYSAAGSGWLAALALMGWRRRRVGVRSPQA